MKRERIDKLLVAAGLADSRTKAQALVMAGVVLADEQRVEKSSQEFSTEVALRIKGETAETRYASRGGLKLEKALEEFGVEAADLICLDIGASTGGFTDCLLQRGAKKVVAIDAGTNQMVWRLRNDERVDVRENVNARYLKPEDLGEKFDLIVMDVSFISVTKIFPVLGDLLKENGKMIVLIKPQFEVGKGEVGKGGIVREDEKHQRVVKEVNASAAEFGFEILGLIESPILGGDGNKEFLGFYKKLQGAN
ncbi:MAG TPA: TlyA family RNA methyltransferase [Pyrinomonadaceae bacterium]|jgi:23S rRNA (cytidine1920-2'-O)/16S rRNA (cytidine1409-2'-O)-methyltransferase|nr:TlyA family RNA methyltransferase [Pyrinomonadaceae bacterium]